jgi:hypothetical protein
LLEAEPARDLWVNRQLGRVLSWVFLIDKDAFQKKGASGLRHMLTVLDGHSRAEWPVALIDWLGNSSDCDLFRRTLRICVQDI